MDKSYNGYTNQETWTMALYLEDSFDWTEGCESAEEVEENLRYFFIELAKEDAWEVLSDPFYELLELALSKVDWHQLANNLFEENRKEE